MELCCIIAALGFLDALMNMKFRQFFLKVNLIVLTLFISACVNNAALESERVQQEQAELARQEQVRAEQAELEQNRRQAEAARIEAEREALARQEAERQREIEAAEARSLAEEARMAAEREAEELREAAALVRQQERVEELSQRVQSINEQTAIIESSNEILSEALEAAEAMSTALSEEGQKFDSLDPVTGSLDEDLDAERLSELAARLERLRAEAAALQAQ